MAYDDLLLPHRFIDSVSWNLVPGGLSVEGAPPETTDGVPATVKRIWTDFMAEIDGAAARFQVPAELIIATIATESSGNPTARREEPGFISDNETPNRVSVGLMQTLLSTARWVLDNNSLSTSDLEVPGQSIEAGCAYIARQFSQTQFDPPLVASAYNAGGVYYNGAAANRWKTRQYPVGSSHHVDRFVKWFNDCFRYFDAEDVTPSWSFRAWYRGELPE